LTSICHLNSPNTLTVPHSRCGATTCTSTPRSVADLRKRVTNTLLNKFSTPVPTLSPPVLPAKSAFPTTTQLRNWSGASTTAPFPTRPSGTSPPTRKPRMPSSLPPMLTSPPPRLSQPPQALVRQCFSRVPLKVVPRPGSRMVMPPRPAPSVHFLPSSLCLTVKTA